MLKNFTGEKPQVLTTGGNLSVHPVLIHVYFTTA